MQVRAKRARRWAAPATAILGTLLLTPALAFGGDFVLKHHGKLEDNAQATVTLKADADYKNGEWSGKVTHFIVTKVDLGCGTYGITLPSFDFQKGGAESTLGWRRHYPKLDKAGQFDWKQGHDAISGELHQGGETASGVLRIVGGADLGGCDTGVLHWRVTKK